MATVSVAPDSLRIHLGPWEVLGGFQTSFSIPRSAIRGVHVTDETLSEVRGMRLPGTGLPGVIALGHFRGGGNGRTFAAAYRGRAGLVLELEGTRFDRVVVSTDEAEAIAAQLVARV